MDFSPVQGSEQGGRRPAVVVSNDVANQHGSVVTVVPVTSAPQKKKYPQNVPLPANDPLPQAGTIYCGQVRTISKKRLDGHRGDLSLSQLREVERALCVVFSLPKPERLN